MDNRGLFIATVLAGVGLSLGVAVGSSAQPAAERARATRVDATAPAIEPVVVELFTAQGCSGCAPANRLVETLAERPGVIALTYSVDYWDYLGWTDTFARPEFSQRQRAYQTALGLRGVYTPQIVIDGRRQVSGAEGPAVQAAVDQEAARRVFPPEVQFRETGEAVGVGAGTPPRGGADVWAVTFRQGRQDVEVSGGDNRGKVVGQVNVVRSLTQLGPWTGRPILLPLPAGIDAEDGVVIMVQSRADRRILTAAVR